MVYPAIGTAVGCWLGVCPSALDWDRPWQVRVFRRAEIMLFTRISQAWPLTPAFGSILGYIIASMYALTISGMNYLADEHVRSLSRSKKVN